MVGYEPKQEYLGLLIDTDELAQLVNDSRFTIVDTRSHEEYILGHVPNSVNIPNNTVKGQSDPVHVMQGEELISLMLSLGIKEDTHDIAYDGNFGMSATRLWWVLDYNGHSVLSLMVGG